MKNPTPSVIRIAIPLDTKLSTSSVQNHEEQKLTVGWVPTVVSCR